jgi:hypothetical protein
MLPYSRSSCFISTSYFRINKLTKDPYYFQPVRSFVYSVYTVLQVSCCSLSFAFDRSDGAQFSLHDQLRQRPNQVSYFAFYHGDVPWNWKQQQGSDSETSFHNVSCDVISNLYIYDVQFV